MSELARDVQSIVDGWMQSEQSGVQFPVPFDAAWRIAGYSTKANGKRALKGLKEGKDFSSDLMKNGQRGRSAELISISCDALKHLCLMADTPEGEQIRDYFIDVEKSWRIVQKIAPEVAKEADIIKLKIELAKQEAIKALEQVRVQAVNFVLGASNQGSLFDSFSDEELEVAA